MTFSEKSRNYRVKHFTIFLKVNLFFFIFLQKNYCQINNEAFGKYRIDSSVTTKWQIDFQSISYFHNREYFGKIADGYTLFGNNLSPKLTYKPNQKVSIEAGLFIRKDFGNQGIKNIQPTFTIVIEKDSGQFRFGNLKGNLNHNLIEPLYNFEGIISNNLESGIQYTKVKNKTFLDIWVDWQRMIYNNSPYKEEIWGGVHWKPTVYSGSKFNVKTPIQFTAYHKGGQITVDKSPLKTELNLAAGIETNWSNAGIFKKISLQNYFLLFQHQSNIVRNYKSGAGYYLNATFETRKLNAMISYYYGNSLNSFTGGDLFQSVNKNNELNTEKYRKLLIFRLYKDFEIIPNLFLIARFEPYFDLLNKRFEHSEGLFISFREKFGLAKRKF